MNDLPLVTCLCLTTAGRTEFLRRAIDCYCRQTYENKQLLIVADTFRDFDGLDEDVHRVVAVFEDMAVLITQEPKRNIGQKRNMGCESAKGDLIAIWDDDDYSAPGRLADQVQQLSGQDRRQVTSYGRMRFTDGDTWWCFDYPEGFAAGTSLMFRRDWWAHHPFNEGEYGMVGEDCRFITQAHQAGVLYRSLCREFMYATIHPGNTSKKFPDRDPGWTRLPGFEWKD